MKCTCPTCGKTTAVEADVGDFPTRCQRCNALLRIAHKSAPARRPRSDRSDEPRARPARIQQGALAGLLVSRSHDTDAAPRIFHAHASSAAPAASPARSERRRLLRPESLREIARAAARQKALRRAELRSNHQALGVLGKLGFVIAAGLCIAALILEARVLLNPVAAAHADIVKTSPAPTAP
jgi:hypothetical protein